jgi:hypothetical protein
MADFDVQGKITFDATQAQTALKQTSTAADQTAASTAKVGEAAKSSVPQIGQFGSALGLAGQAVGKLSPQMGGLVSLVGTATGAMQSLMTAGLGPVGIAIGAVSVAISAATALWNSQEESIKRNEAALREYDKIQSEIAARRRQEALDAELQNRDEEYYHSEAGRRARAQANWEIGYQRTRAADLRTMALLAEGLPEQQDRPRGGGRRAQARYSYEGSGDARRDIERENRWIEKEEQESNARQLEDLNNFLSESADIANYYREREREEEEKQKKALAEIQQKAEDERLEAAKRTKELILETSMESLDTVLSAFDEAATANLEAMLTGGKMTAKATREMVKETMLALTTESIVQGLKQTALGLGALAMGSPSAALHFASAAKFAAVGVAAGVAGAAAGGFKGVGQESDTAAPAAATGGPALSSGATGAMASTVVINWGSSGLVYAADRAQLGRDIAGMIGEANSRLGRGM